jgi:ATP-dependent protease ClpP protease subunit
MRNNDSCEPCDLKVLKGTVSPSSERELLRDLRIICLTGDIDDVTATEFIQDMTLLTSKSKKPITIIFASNGGEVDSGLACVRAIKGAQSKKIKVIGTVYGHCMSMAFLVLQCCDTRIMGTGDILMAHGITAFRFGDIRNHKAETKLLEFWQKYFAHVVASRCKDKKKFCTDYWITALADQMPQYFTSKECLDMGLIDDIEEPQEEVFDLW